MSTPAPAKAMQANDTVAVTARGRTLWTAHQEAVRQALASAVRVAGAGTPANSPMLDPTRARMAGVVETILLDRAEMKGPDHELQVRVVFNAERLTQFLANGGALPKPQPVAGLSLPEQDRALRAIERERALMVARLLWGFPDLAFQLSVDSVGLAPDSLTWVRVVGTWRADPAFVAHVARGLSLLGTTCGVPGCLGKFVWTYPNSTPALARTVEVTGIDVRTLASSGWELTFQGEDVRAIVMRQRRVGMYDVQVSNMRGRFPVGSNCSKYPGKLWHFWQGNDRQMDFCLNPGPLDFTARLPVAMFAGFTGTGSSDLQVLAVGGGNPGPYGNSRDGAMRRGPLPEPADMCRTAPVELLRYGSNSVASPRNLLECLSFLRRYLGNPDLETIYWHDRAVSAPATPSAPPSPAATPPGSPDTDPHPAP